MLHEMIQPILSLAARISGGSKGFRVKGFRVRGLGFRVLKGGMNLGALKDPSSIGALLFHTPVAFASRFEQAANRSFLQKDSKGVCWDR